MADALGRGLFRRTSNGVWHARGAAPKDLRRRGGRAQEFGLLSSRGDLPRELQVAL